MRLSKRVADKLQKENFAAIGREMGLNRATVSIWAKKGEVPHYRIDELSEYLGYKIK